MRFCRDVGLIRDHIHGYPVTLVVVLVDASHFLGEMALRSDKQVKLLNDDLGDIEVFAYYVHYSMTI